MASRKDTYSIYPTAPTSYTNRQRSIRVLGRTSDNTRIDKQRNQAKQELPITPPSSVDEDSEGRREEAHTIYRDAHRSEGISHQRTPLDPLTGNTTPWRQSPTRLTKDTTPRSSSTRAALPDLTVEEHVQHMSYDASTACTSTNSASRSSRERVTGLRPRGSSVTSDPHTRVSPTSTLDKRVLHATQSIIPDSYTSSQVLHFQGQLPRPPSIALENRLSDRTMPNPSSVNARAIVPIRLPRKPLPVKLRTSSPKLNHSQYANTCSTPTSPTSLPLLAALPASPLGSLASYPDEPEPQSFWDSDDDDDDDDEKTLMRRMKSSLHLPRRLSGGDRDKERKQIVGRDGRVGSAGSAKVTSWRRGASVKRFVLCVCKERGD